MSTSNAHEPRIAGPDRNGEGRLLGSVGAAAIVAIALVLLAGPESGPAQERQSSEQQRCDLMEDQFLRSILTADGERITYMSGPVLFVCEDGTRIRADSVVQFSADQFRELIGSVEIDGPETRVTADRIHLSAETGRTQAWGDVQVVEKEADTRMVGDTLVFLEAGQFRERDRLEMWGGSPYAVLRLEGEEAPDTTTRPEDLPQRIVLGRDEPEEPEDTVREPSPPPPPDTVFGDRLYMEGQTRFRAGGSVRIRRSEMEAFGDSLDYDRELSRAFLQGTDSVPARIEGEEYDLAGREVDLRIQGRRVNRVDARGDARLTGEDVQIEAPRIRTFLTEGEIERLVAVQGAPTREDGAPDSTAAGRRPETVAEDFLLRADSIDVQAPERILQQVVAVGRARGESLGRDSLNTAATPETIRRDWIEGDTVVAHFVPPDSAREGAEEVADTAGDRPRLDRLVATGSARTLYRTVPRDSVRGEEADTSAGASGPAAEVPDSLALSVGDTVETGGASDPAEPASDTPRSDRRLAVHYVVGDRITIVLREGEVESMEVMGQTRGLYLQPRGNVSPPGTVPDTVPQEPADGDSGQPIGPSGRRGEP